MFLAARIRRLASKTPRSAAHPWGVCPHGSVHGWAKCRGDFAATARLLLDAGERCDPSDLPTGRDDVDAGAARGGEQEVRRQGVIPCSLRSGTFQVPFQYPRADSEWRSRENAGMAGPVRPSSESVARVSRSAGVSALSPVSRISAMPTYMRAAVWGLAPRQPAPEEASHVAAVEDEPRERRACGFSSPSETRIDAPYTS